MMLRPALYMAALTALGGCVALGGRGSLRAESLGRDPVTLKSPTVAAVYAHGQAPETSFFLSDVSLRALLDDGSVTAQVVHIELLWMPKPGRTPLDPSATNASIRYVLIVGEELGVYGGAGFVLPHGRPGKRRLAVTVKDASLTLLEATPGFVDRLGPTQLTGEFAAQRDDATCRQLRYAVSQRVTNALGRTRMVDQSPIERLLVMLQAQ